jgi:hypothetical protein
MKMYWEVAVSHRMFSALPLDGSGQIHAPTLYIRGKNPKYPLDRKLCGPQNRYGRCGEEEDPCPYWESNLGRPARSLVTILTELSLILSERCKFEIFLKARNKLKLH